MRDDFDTQNWYESMKNRVAALEIEIRNAKNEISDLESQLRALNQKVEDVAHKVNYP